MNTPQTITMDMVRDAMQAFCKGGKTISNAQLYEALGLTCEQEKDRLRTRVNGMVKSGEAVKVKAGLYDYNFSYRVRKNTTYPKIYRFVRKQKPGWSISFCSQLLRISYTQVLRYCLWLEENGFLAKHGKEGNTILYRGTKKADLTPETPYPSSTDKNPFERESAAAAKIARLMLCHDPYARKTAREITDACHVLLARFDKTFTQSENANDQAKKMADAT